MVLSNPLTQRCIFLGLLLISNISLLPAQKLPKEILVKTPTQAKDSEFEYALAEGKLYYRKRLDSFLTGQRKWALPLLPNTTILPNPKMPALPGNNEWQLFMGDGLPDSTHHLEQDKLVKVMADADEVVVFDEQGRGWWFRHRTSYFKWPMGQWLDSFGQPVDVPYVIPSEYWPAPAIALGRRNEDVKYFEDSQGHQHHWGTFPISTHYVLSKDNQHIYLLDPGIPLDFRYELCPPWKGQKKILALDASGGTMMAMDEDGMILTRLEDFDTNGLDSMLFRYSYDEANADEKKPKGESSYSRWAPYYLDRKDQWLLHPWNLPEGAKISSTISIFSTGVGNSARILRVAGVNQFGRPGVFQKMISESEWSFLASEEVSEINVEKYFAPKVNIPTGENHATTDFSGKINWQNQEYQVEVSDFHQGCADTTVKISIENQSYTYQLYHDQAYTQLNLREFHLPHPYLALATWRKDEFQPQNPVLPNLIAELNNQENKMFSWRLILDKTNDQLSLYPTEHPELRFQLASNKKHFLVSPMVNGDELNNMLGQLKEKQRFGNFAGHVLSLHPLVQYRYMGEMIPTHLNFYVEAYSFWEEELMQKGQQLE